MGHVRVIHAIEVAEAAGSVAAGWERDFDEVAPFALWERVLARQVPQGSEFGLYRLRWHLLRSLRARRLVRRHHRERVPDVVLVTTAQVAMLLDGVQADVACVPSLDVTTSDWLRMLLGLSAGARRLDLRLIEALERRALGRAPLSIAWTGTVADSVRRLAPGATVEVLHPGLDLERFTPGASGRRRGPFRVLFVGGSWERKGGPELLRALDGLIGTEVALDVVSSVSLPPRPGLTVHQLSAASEELIGLFRAADVLCLPSHCDAVPWVIAEALACGLPIVASTVGSIEEMVGEAGRCVPPGDVAGLRDAIRELAESPQRRAEMAQVGRFSAEQRYDARVNTRRLFELLEGVANVDRG